MLPAFACAVDLGAIGPVYPIQEPHLLEFIAKRLREKQRSGELKKFEEEAARAALAASDSRRPWRASTRRKPPARSITTRRSRSNATFSMTEASIRSRHAQEPA